MFGPSVDKFKLSVVGMAGMSVLTFSQVTVYKVNTEDVYTRSQTTVDTLKIEKNKLETQRDEVRDGRGGGMEGREGREG